MFIIVMRVGYKELLISIVAALMAYATLNGFAIACGDSMAPLANLRETTFLNLRVSKPIEASGLTGVHVGLYEMSVSENVIRRTLMCKNYTLDEFLKPPCTSLKPLRSEAVRLPAGYRNLMSY